MGIIPSDITVIFSPQTLDHIATFDGDSPPDRTEVFVCDLINVDEPDQPIDPQIVTVRFIGSESELVIKLFCMWYMKAENQSRPIQMKHWKLHELHIKNVHAPEYFKSISKFGEGGKFKFFRVRPLWFSALHITVRLCFARGLVYLCYISTLHINRSCGHSE